MLWRLRGNRANCLFGGRMNKDQLLAIIAEHTRQVLPGLDTHDFVGSDRLTDLGANSVDRAEIAMLVQESLSLTIPRVELFGPKNIGELAELFLAKLRGIDATRR